MPEPILPKSRHEQTEFRSQAAHLSSADMTAGTETMSTAGTLPTKAPGQAPGSLEWICRLLVDRGAATLTGV